MATRAFPLARPLKNIGGEIVELNFVIRGHNVRVRLAHVHTAQHAATNTQISRSSITA